MMVILEWLVLLVGALVVAKDMAGRNERLIELAEDADPRKAQIKRMVVVAAVTAVLMIPMTAISYALAAITG